MSPADGGRCAAESLGPANPSDGSDVAGRAPQALRRL